MIHGVSKKVETHHTLESRECHVSTLKQSWTVEPCAFGADLSDYDVTGLVLVERIENTRYPAAC